MPLFITRKCHALLTLCMLVHFSYSIYCLLTFCKINLFENFFQEHYQNAEGSTDHDLHYVGREHSGSVVECLTRDREAAGSSLELTSVTVLCP